MDRAHIFIRNDDVWTLDEAFCYYFDLALSHAIPIVHAVIPGKIDQALVQFLCQAKEKHPALIDIVQHGWVHANHSDEAGQKYEFGKSRAYADQARDIAMGKARMQAAFGDAWTPAFVPPFHGYDAQMSTMLDDGGFKMFSAGRRGLGQPSGLLELPATISFSDYGNHAAPSIKTAVAIVEDLAQAIHHVPLCGVITHHEDFKTPASRQELEKFFRLLASKQNRGEWRVLLFSELERLRHREVFYE